MKESNSRSATDLSVTYQDTDEQESVDHPGQMYFDYGSDSRYEMIDQCYPFLPITPEDICYGKYPDYQFEDVLVEVTKQNRLAGIKNHFDKALDLDRAIVALNYIYKQVSKVEVPTDKLSSKLTHIQNLAILKELIDKLS